MEKLSCKQFTQALNAIKEKKLEFDNEFNGSNFDHCSDLTQEITKLIHELWERAWKLEVITKELLKTQLQEWQSVYASLGINKPLPQEGSLLEFLVDNEFSELMRTKEKQGFTQLVIAPLELCSTLESIDNKVVTQGGSNCSIKNDTDDWKKFLASEANIHYFSHIENDRPNGGYTIDEIKANPQKFNLLDGWFISFIKSRQSIVKGSGADEIDASGRIEIKGGKQPQEYQSNYFSGKNPHYLGEEPLIPQEWLALFARDIYEKYLKDNRRINNPAPDLLDAETSTLFISTFSPEENGFLGLFWSPDELRIYLETRDFEDCNGLIAPRAVVRKPIKIN